MVRCCCWTVTPQAATVADLIDMAETVALNGTPEDCAATEIDRAGRAWVGLPVGSSLRQEVSRWLRH